MIIIDHSAAENVSLKVSRFRAESESVACLHECVLVQSGEGFLPLPGFMRANCSLSYRKQCAQGGHSGMA